MHKNHCFFGVYLPQLPAGCAFRRRIHLRPHRFRTTTAVETVRRTCWKNVGNNVEISINQQVSFNLWPSSRMFWQRLEQLWALKREGLQMFDTHEPYWFWSRYFFMKRMGFSNLQSTGNRQTKYRFPTDLSNVDVDKQTNSKVETPR